MKSDSKNSEQFTLVNNTQYTVYNSNTPWCNIPCWEKDFLAIFGSLSALSSAVYVPAGEQAYVLHDLSTQNKYLSKVILRPMQPSILIPRNCCMSVWSIDQACRYYRQTLCLISQIPSRSIKPCLCFLTDITI